MAVKVHCSICDVFIKNVEPFELQKLTGKEICPDCAKRIAETIKEIDTAQKEFMAEAKDLLQKSRAKYAKMDATYAGFVEQSKDMLLRMRAELEDRVQRVLEGNENNKMPDM